MDSRHNISGADSFDHTPAAPRRSSNRGNVPVRLWTPIQSPPTGGSRHCALPPPKAKQSLKHHHSVSSKENNRPLQHTALGSAQNTPPGNAIICQTPVPKRGSPTSKNSTPQQHQEIVTIESPPQGMGDQDAGLMVQCGVCDKNVLPNSDAAECENCRSWIHKICDL